MPVVHDPAFRALWSTGAAAIPDKVLPASCEPSSIGVVAIFAVMIETAAQVIAQRHAAGFNLHVWLVVVLHDLILEVVRAFILDLLCLALLALLFLQLLVLVRGGPPVFVTLLWLPLRFSVALSAAGLLLRRGHRVL